MEGQAATGEQQQTTQPTTGDATGQQAGQQTGQQGNGGSGEDKRFSQAELEAIVKDRLERQRRATEAQSQKEREATEAKALEEQQQFQKLAEQRQKRIEELEPLEARLTEAEEALTALLETERKGLPAHITSLLDDLTPAKQLTWIAANREAIGAATATNGRATQGVPATPRAAAPATHADLVKQEQDALRATGSFLV